jgi:hypothetical protein
MTFLPANILYLDPSGTNWAAFSTCFQETMQVMGQWGYFDGTKACPMPKKADMPTDMERDVVERWAHEDVVACYLLSQRLPDMTTLHLFNYPTAKARWEQLVEEHRAKSAYAQNDLEVAFFEMTCPKGGNVWAFLMDLCYKHEELAAAGMCITDKEYECTILRGIPDELARFTPQLLATTHVVHHTATINLDILIGHICEEAECLKNRRARSQKGQEWDKKGEGLTSEAFAATQSEGRKRTCRRGKCHTCGEGGHWAHVCHASKNKEATMPALEASSGATAQPETEAMEATHTVVLKGEGLWMAEEGATHTQNVNAELGLSQALPENPTPEVYVQTVIAEPHPISGKPGGLEKVAHTQPVAAEPDLPGGQPGDLKEDARTHLASVEPGNLMNAEEDWLLEVEGEETAINAAFKEDADPRIDLQGNGVSHPNMHKEDMFLTFLSSPLHNTLEAARMQRSPPIDEGTLPIEGPEPSSHVNMVPPLLDIPLPEKAAEPPDWPSPEQA